MDHYAIWNKSDRERQIPLSSHLYVEFFFQKAHREYIDSYQRWGWRLGEMGEDGEKVQTYSYKI